MFAHAILSQHQFLQVFQLILFLMLEQKDAAVEHKCINIQMYKYTNVYLCKNINKNNV